jgi:hypothetical protein
LGKKKIIGENVNKKNKKNDEKHACVKIKERKERVCAREKIEKKNQVSIK